MRFLNYTKKVEINPPVILSDSLEGQVEESPNKIRYQFAVFNEFSIINDTKFEN